MKDLYHQIFRFFTGTLFSRISGLCRDMAMAYSFGTSASTATFFAAYRLSQAPRRILGEGGMQTAFIPHYQELKQNSPEKAHQFFIDLSAFVSILIGIILAIWMLGYYIVAPFLSETAAEVAFLTFLMGPGLLFICLYGLSSALLEANGSFFRSSAAPIAFNIVWIIAALLLRNVDTEAAVTLLSLAIGLACFAQWGVLLPKTWKILAPQRLFIDANLGSPDLKKWFGPLFLANFGVVAQQVNGALDPLFALWANSEGPALLWYALRIEQAPLALIGIAISRALLPALSKTREDPEQFQQLLQGSLKKGLLLMGAATLFIVITAPWIVKILFERGDFTSESTWGVTYALWGYSLGLMPQAAILILAPAFYAKKEYKIPARAAILSVFANLFFNSLFVFGFGMGAISVAIATSLASFVNAAILFWKTANLKKI